MTKEKALEALTKAAEFVEAAIKLDEETDGLFCLGTDTERQIHISQSRWDEITNAIQPVITYDPNWDHSGEYTMARFTQKLLGKEYKVFALIERREQR